MELDRAEANLSVATPTVPMSGIWRTIRSYILWSHERGTIQYDVMVTLILIFVLFSPKVINFKDKPVGHNPLRTGVMVSADDNGGLIYQVDGSAVSAKDDAAVRSELLHIIEPISGEVNITKIESVRDGSGKILRYKVWVEKE
ncbi:MAG TPA: hypothetical protein VMB18_07740 [Terriglobales bacterium]|nr:hypothetical protein [Terriglobales bacterium]